MKRNDFFPIAIFVLVLSTILSSCGSLPDQRQMKNDGNSMYKDSLVCRIDIQDYFENDTISLILMDSTFMNSEVVTSNPIAGFTGIAISVKKLGNSSVVVSRYKQPNWVIATADASFLNSNTITCKLVVNGKIFQLNEDITKEKYIGISKMIYSDSSWGISVIKSSEKFSYY